MRKIKIILSFFILLLLLLFISCNSNEDNPITTEEAALLKPTNMMAYSKSATEVGLQWTKSADVTKSNFASYSLAVTNMDNGTVVGTAITVSKTDSTYTVTGLTEGVIYKFVLTSKSTSGKAGGSDSITWSPAKRIDGQQGGIPIKVYETKSPSFPSGLDLQNSTGYAEAVSISASNPAQANRADLYVYTVTTNDNLEMRSPKLSTAIPIPRETKFSTEFYEVSSLNDPRSAPPATYTYTLDFVTVPTGTRTTPRIYFAKTQEGNYVRILATLSTSNSLIWGTKDDRYVNLVISYQSKVNVPYAKTSNKN